MRQMRMCVRPVRETVLRGKQTFASRAFDWQGLGSTREPRTHDDAVSIQGGYLQPCSAMVAFQSAAIPSRVSFAEPPSLSM